MDRTLFNQQKQKAAREKAQYLNLQPPDTDPWFSRGGDKDSTSSVHNESFLCERAQMDRVRGEQGWSLGYAAMSTAKRSQSNPLKQNPTHFNHGARNYKNCLICEGKNTAGKQEAPVVATTEYQKK